MVDTIKFSQMTAGGDLPLNSKTPGLLSGANVLFNNPWTFLPPGTTAQRPSPSSAINYRLRFNTDDLLYEYYDADLGQWVQLQESAFTVGPFVTYTDDPTLPDAQNLGILADGILRQTITTGVATLDIAVNGVDYYGPGFTGYLESPIGIKDSLGNIVVAFTTTPSPDVYIDIQNSVVGNGAVVTAGGASADIGVLIKGKAAGGVGFFTENTSVPFNFYSGTGAQHVTNFAMANTAANRTATWQDSDGTVAWLSDVAGTVTSLTGTANQVLVNGTSGSAQTGAITLTLPQDIDTASSPTFNNLKLTGGTLLDTNGNVSALFQATGSAVNYLLIGNNALGSSPYIASAGAGTDVALALLSKGDNSVSVTTQAISAAPFLIRNGTGAQHQTNFLFANTANVRNATFQDSDGTVAWLTDIPAGSPSALTRVDDTNVTISLGGTPSTALLQAVSLTMGWSGTLAPSRGGLGTGTAPVSGQIPIGNSGGTYTIAAITSGTNILVGNGDGTISIGITGIISPTNGGTGVNNGSNTLTLAGNLATSGAFASTFTMTGATSVTFPTSGTLATTSQIPTGAALTKTDDTNVTLTLGGSPTTALVNAASLTLGWTGQLGLTRGGTAASLTASNGGIVYSTSSALAILAGTATAGQMLQSGASTTPAWSTTTYPSTNAINTIMYASSANVLGSIAAANSSVLVTSAGGVPSMSTTLPNINIGTPTAGVLTNTTGGGGVRSFQVFTSGTAATYTKPSNVTSILVEVVGGGGGGGGCADPGVGNVSAAGGGAGGGYARLWVAAASSTYTYTVGSGGAGGIGGNDGATGGTTTFSASSLQATGGGGGTQGTASSTGNFAKGSKGGVGSNGNINGAGGFGAYGTTIGGALASGSGGSSIYGGGGDGRQGSVGTGTAAIGNGGGGGGASASNGSAQTGGAGSAGIIIVWEFS